MGTRGGVEDARRMLGTRTKGRKISVLAGYVHGYPRRRGGLMEDGRYPS